MTESTPPHPATAVEALNVARDTSNAAFFAIFTERAQSLPTFRAVIGLPEPDSQAAQDKADPAVRRELHRRYRETTASLLGLQREHNQSDNPSSLRDLETIAQPLVQQTLIEADLANADGDVEEAAGLRDWAFEIASECLTGTVLARVERDRAVLMAREGRFNEALTALADLGVAFGQSGEVIEAAQSALEEAVILEWLGDHERSLGVIDRAAQLVRPNLQVDNLSLGGTAQAFSEELHSVGKGLGPTGAAYEAASLWRVAVELIEHEARNRRALGEYDQAALLFQSVLEPYSGLDSSRFAVEFQLAAIDADRGRYAASEERIARIEPEFDSGLLRPRRSGLRILQADDALGLNAPERASAFAEDGIADLIQFPDDDLAWKLHWRRGRAHAALGRAEEALTAYGSAAAIVDSLRKAPLGYRLDSTYLQSKLPMFESAIALAAEQGNGRACAHFIELVKARALSSALSIRPSERSDRSEFEIEFDRITTLLDAIEYQGYRGTAAPADVQRERATLLARRLDLVEQVRLRDPRWRGLTQAVPFDPERLAHDLGERNQAALTLYMYGGRVISVLFAEGKIEVGSQVLSADTQDAIDQYAANLLRWKPDPFLLDLSDLNLGAEAFVPQRLLEKARGAEALLIAPHGVLHLLPWPTLTVGAARLFQSTAVGLLPNLTCVSALDADFSATPRAALAGAPRYEGLPELGDLPATAAEIDELGRLYEGRLLAPPVIGPAATEHAVRVLAARADADGAILHISCHGTLSVEDPLGSGLLLSDGKIDAAELADTRIRYEEVVLSACSTGWRPQAAQGVALSGDDILGLPGALLEAGTRSVVVSIPKAADDATAAFMIAYHRRRAGGASPLNAFRDTQRELLASHHEPYKWAGIVCYAVR